MNGPGWLLQNAGVAAVAAGALLVLFRFWRPRPAVEHLLWLAVVVKLVLPPIAAVPVPGGAPQVLREAGVVGAADPAASRPAFVGGESTGPGMSSHAHASAPGGPPSEAAALMERGSRSGGGEAPAPLWALWLGAIWAAGALVATGSLLLRHLRFRRGLAAEEVPDDLRAIVASVAGDVGIEPPKILVSTRVPTPVVVGIARPSLIWPRGLRLPRDRMRMVVAHELAHLRRRDLWSGPFELAAGAIWWWYPACWLVRRRLRDAAERACDDLVVSLYPQHRRAYAEALLDVLSLDVRRRPIVGLGVNGPGPVRTRLERILRADPTASRGATYAAVALAALALLPTWADAPRESPPVTERAGLASDTASMKGPSPLGGEERGIIAIASRGVVRVSDATVLPELEPDGWFIAVADAGAGPIRRLELRRDGDRAPRVRHRIGDRVAPVGPEVATWLDDIMRDAGYDPATTRPGAPATAAWVPTGPHAHRTDGSEMLALWPSTSRAVGMEVPPDSAADPDRPLLIVYQAHPEAPVVAVTLVRLQDGIRVLDAAIDGAPVDSDAEAELWGRRLLSRAADRRMLPREGA